MINLKMIMIATAMAIEMPSQLLVLIVLRVYLS